MEKLQLVIFILGLVIGGFIIYLFFRLFHRAVCGLSEEKRLITDREELFDLTTRKGKNLDEILKYINSKKQIRNDDIEKLFRVSDSTATRYLQELKDTGKIKQIGKLGKYVYYEKI